MNQSSYSSKVLVHLFLTEMWERFSYYGVNALLILYLSHQWKLPDTQIYVLYGAYGALVYATAVFGGLISDYFVGPYYAVLIGGWLLMVGHFVLMWPSSNHSIFFLGLAFIVLGTGLFKPGINTLVASLYRQQEDNRQQGFVLTYIGSNVGTVIAPVVSSMAALYWGWHIAFGLAGLGMLAGLINFRLAKPYFPAQVCQQPEFLVYKLIGLIGVVLLGLFGLLMHARWVGYGLSLVILGTVYLLCKVIRDSMLKVQQVMKKVLVLLGFYIIFMVLLQQSGGALNLFTDRFINKQFLGWSIPTGVYQSVEPLALIVLSSIFLFWQKRTKVNVILNYSHYFARALCLIGSSFFVLVLGLMLNNQQALLAMTWMNTSYILQAAGEVFIAPIGLAMLSEHIPEKHLGLFMGTWVLASALANFIAAKIGVLTSLSGTPSIHGLSGVVNQYSLAFGLMGVLGIGSALGLWLMRRKFKYF